MFIFGIPLGNQGLQEGTDTLKVHSSACNNIR